MRGVNPASTPSSASFADWNKCGSRTRDTRFIRPLLYPSELTCGGMKQSARAVRARATRSGAQARQVGWRTHYRCTFDVSTSSRDRAPMPGLKSSIPLPPSTSHRPKRRDPGGQCRPGSLEEVFRGLPYGQPRNSSEFRLTHHVIQGTRRRAARKHEIPCADLRRRMLPRAKVCRFMIHRGAHFTQKIGRVNKFRKRDILGRNRSAP